jgi:hypothetical protein
MLKICGETIVLTVWRHDVMQTIVLTVWRHDVMLSRGMSILNLQTFLITILLYSYFVVLEMQVRLRLWEAVQCCLPHSFLYSALCEVVRCLGVFV